MSSAARPSLRRALGVRSLLAGAAAVIVLAVIVAVFYRVQKQRQNEAWIRDVQAHFDLQTRRLDNDWARQAELLRAQILYAGLLDGDDERLSAARFVAYLANLGGQGTFTHVLVLAADGHVVSSYGTRSGELAPPTAHGAAWVYSEVDGFVYRVLHLPMPVVGAGPGQLILYVPINQALLSSIAFPDAHLSLHWRGRDDVAHSRAASGWTAGSREPRPIEGLLEWAGDSSGPRLRISRETADVVSRDELLGLVLLGAIGTATLRWLAIGRWSRRHVAHIDGLAAAVDRFAAGTKDLRELQTELAAIAARSDLETGRLATGLAAMMKATEAADAAKESARRHLADLNATLEERVAQRTKELEAARDDALAAARARQRILAGVSHEMRTPLVGLLGSLDLIDAPSMPAEARRLVDVARQSGLALRSVIDDVLDYSRLEAVGAELREIPFQLRDLVAESIGLHAAVAVQKGLQLSCEGDLAGLPRVQGDPARLRQVLLNLIGNAVKFTDRGGRVDLSVRATPRIDGQRVNVRFEVRDSGVGIAPSDQDRLFRPFAQVAGGSGRGGTGLGLAIAQRIVAAMGGRIEVSSRPGGGTTFWFEIDLAVAGSAPDASMPEDGRCRLTGCVLLVEDNEVNRMVTSEMLRRIGVQVLEAENGLLAIEALRHQPVDLVLLDYNMPVLDGPQTAARIRAGDAGADVASVPIVTVTAHARIGDVDFSLSPDFDDYLAKPFSLHELEQKVAIWLERRHAAAPRA